MTPPCGMLLTIATLTFVPGVDGLGGPTAWPRFRGPDAGGVADDPRLPVRWGPDENVVWKTEIPGSGWSSPIVWGRRIFVTTVTSDVEEEERKKGLYLGGERPVPSGVMHHWWVLAIDLDTGQIVWKREVHAGTPPTARHLKNTYASETPVTDGRRVYACFGNVGVFTLDFDGGLIWERRLPAYDTRDGWGTGASPALHGDRLFIVHDNEMRSYLMALNAATGEPIWEVQREEQSNWATPLIWENPLRTELVTNGQGKIRSYDLDGNLLWEIRRGSWPVVASPLAAGDLLYVASGWVMDNFRPVRAVRPGAAGDISLEEGRTSNDFVVWEQTKLGPYHPTPIVVGDYFYTLLDQGFFLCHEARTGREIYGRQRISAASGSFAVGFTASPWSYRDRVFCLNEDGDTFVIRAGPVFEVLAVNSLNEMCMATPAIADGSLIVRSARRLYRIADPSPGSN